MAGAVDMRVSHDPSTPTSAKVGQTIDYKWNLTNVSYQASGPVKVVFEATWKGETVVTAAAPPAAQGFSGPCTWKGSGSVSKWECPYASIAPGVTETITHPLAANGPGEWFNAKIDVPEVAGELNFETKKSGVGA